MLYTLLKGKVIPYEEEIDFSQSFNKLKHSNPWRLCSLDKAL